MEWFVDNWPVLLVILAVLIVFMGLIQKVIKLALIGVAIGALGLVVWPLVAS